MKLLFDHQLSLKLVAHLADLYPDLTHVYLLEMDQEDDAVIWDYARDNGYTIVTKDTDFADLSLLRGLPPKVLWIRLGNCTTAEVEAAIRQHTNEMAAFEADAIIGLMSILR